MCWMGMRFSSNTLLLRDKCEVLEKIFKTKICTAEKLRVIKACQLFDKDPDGI